MASPKVRRLKRIMRKQLLESTDKSSEKDIKSSDVIKTSTYGGITTNIDPEEEDSYFEVNIGVSKSSKPSRTKGRPKK